MRRPDAGAPIARAAARPAATADRRAAHHNRLTRVTDDAIPQSAGKRAGAKARTRKTHRHIGD
jgi:hypothetical protein